MGRADIATLPALTHGVRLCLHTRALVGSAYDDPEFFVGAPEFRFVTIRRNEPRPFRDSRASRKAISLRTTSARSVVTGSQRLGRFLSLTFGGIRDVSSSRLASPW